MTTYRFIAGGALAKIDDDGVSRTSCSADNADYIAWVAQGNVPLPRDPQETQTEAEQEIRAAQTRADAQAIRADARFQNLISKTPAQAKNWVDNNFPSLTDPERKDLATIVIAIGVLGRSL